MNNQAHSAYELWQNHAANSGALAGMGCRCWSDAVIAAVLAAYPEALS